MNDKYFLAASGMSAGDAAGSRVLWSGRCAVAEYAFEEPSSLPRWTLPEETEVQVTDDRVVYRDVTTGATGELQWPWPQHLRVQPGNRDTGRSATVTQIQLVCAGPGGTFPALVFAGGDLATVGDSDRLANVLRQAIARYRVEHAAELGIPAPQARMLSRLVIGPEFNNYQGGEGQTVTLLGSKQVEAMSAPTYAAPTPTFDAPTFATPTFAGGPIEDEPFLEPYLPASGSVPAARISGYAPNGLSQSPPAPYAPPAPYPPQAPYAPEAPCAPEPSQPAFAEPYGGGHAPQNAEPAVAWPAAGGADFGATPPQVLRPGFDALARSRPARPADEATLRGAPDLEERAADLAARVANLVAGGAGLGRGQTHERTNLSAYLADDEPVDRAEQVRRTAARLSANSARGRGIAPRRPADDELGSPTRNA